MPEDELHSAQRKTVYNIGTEKNQTVKLCNTQTTTETVIDMNFLPRQKQNLLSLATILNSSILLKLLKFDIGIFDSLRMERTLPD